MKTIKLLTQAIILATTIVFFACEGDQGEPGPTGPQGEQGIAGEDGQDGTDGQDGNTNYFYFQDGFKGYDGTENITIYNQANFFVQEELLDIPSPNSKNLVIINGNQSNASDPDSIHALMKFTDLKEVIDGEFGADICSEDFYINEAVIYLSGLSQNFSEEDAFLQVGFYGNESPIFDQNFVSWEMANQTEAWDSIGGKESWQYNDPYFDLISPQDPTFDFNYGYIYSLNELLFNRMPIYVPRELAKEWICGSNPGLLLSCIQDDFFSLIYSSTNDNIDARPMLYLNIERNNGSANRQLISDEDAYEDWKHKSYEEKMEPFYKAHPQLK